MNEITVIENNGQRVLTTAQLAECYETDVKTVRDNYSNNKTRYMEGKHYYCLKGDALKQFKNSTENFGVVAKGANSLYLWTEKGALLHAKSLNTDKAWEVYDQLVENYFNPRQIQQKPQMSQLEMIAGIAQGAAELERRTNALETQVQSVSDKLEQALDVFTEPLADTDWNGSINRRISTVCERHHLNQMKTRHELYVELEQIARCNLAARKLHKQKRMEKAGYRYREVQAVSKLDIIAEDPKLMAVFDGVVRRFEARYIQGANVQMGMYLDDLIDF